MNRPLHPLAHIDGSAKLAPGVRVGPFAVIEAGVEIGPDCEIGAGAVIKSGVVMGARNRIGEHAVIGGLPQDLHFDPATASGVLIGDDNTIRELANIHRATKAGNHTTVGNHCLIMVGAHLAHDVKVHNHVVIANYSLCAGFVEVMDHAFISGNCALHQHIRVGRFVMIAGITKLPQDAPPFALIEGHPGRYRTINSVGLKRGGILGADRDKIKGVYRTLYLKHESVAAALADLDGQTLGPLEKEIVDFVKTSRRGILSGPERKVESEKEGVDG